MSKRFCTSLALIVFWPLAVLAGDADKPAAVVRVRSLDALIDNAKLLVTLAGRPEIARQVEGLIKAKIGAQGLEGIDPARPIGAYGRFGKQIDDVTGAVLVPIADEKAFLGLLENLGFNATKGKNDIYTIRTGAAVDVYLRFANRYAYATAVTTTILEGKLPDPAAILGKDGPTISASIHIDQLPELARRLVADKIDEGLQKEGAKQVPGETASQRAVRAAALKEVGKVLTGVVSEGGEVKLAIDLNSKSQELSASVSLAGKAGSDLARSIQKLGQGQSLFGGWRGSDSAFRGVVHAVLPDELKKGLDKLIDDGMAETLGKIQDAAARDKAKQLIDAMLPTLKSGELDACVQALGPGADSKYTVIAGVKVQDGAKLGATLQGLVVEALKQMPEAQRALIKLNFATVGPVKIHRVELPAAAPEVKKLQAFLGETNLHVAFRNDAVFFAIGNDSLSALKDILDKKTSGPSPVLSYELDVAKLAPVIAPTDELRAQAKKIFAGQDGQVRITLAGGDTLRLSLTTRLSVVQFLSLTREAKGAE